MSRTPLPYTTGDISALARSLRAQLAGRSEPPGHVDLLNMLARATGCRNFQHFRAQATAQTRLEQGPPPSPAVDHVKILKIARCFDSAGCLIRWPGKLSERQPILWVLWSRFPAGEVMSEPGVNDRLRAHHRFGDHVLLRREMCDLGLLSRTRDGREYRRVESRPPEDVLALLAHLRTRAMPAA
ncbi:DUF2087 domain-containing protein [Azospirillum sp. TSO22-1]|uniref:DUF2087 domain-containing protein n=1 Tax=Azospirillum sp. TSO22-1 TaxID=716789 RepID=UPI000D60C1EB|nr:DUF2087 domain-containing protein [Azospirillum sp. TSO22-1]PWC57071.1 hypothetical protein TSO221_00045 [Azospirillum sp. TSO22-1]